MTPDPDSNDLDYRLRVVTEALHDLIAHLDAGNAPGAKAVADQHLTRLKMLPMRTG